MVYTCLYASPLGSITLAGDGTALTGLWFEGQTYFAEGIANDRSERDLPVLNDARRWLDIYFDGRKPDFTPPLAPDGSPFRKAVWNILLTIPYGKTMTYGEIAQKIARQTGVSRMSAQAVGGAVAHNPISLIIPCHRVIGTDGSLTGYAGGLERKEKLLMLEKGKMIRRRTPGAAAFLPQASYPIPNS